MARRTSSVFAPRGDLICPTRSSNSLQAAVPEVHHFGHRLGGLLGRDAPESDPAAAIGVGLDDVEVLGLVGAGVPDFAAGEFMEPPDGVLGERQLRGAFGQGVLPEDLEFLGGLAGEKLLLSSGFAEVGQVSTRPRGDRRWLGSELSEGHHGRGWAAAI